MNFTQRPQRAQREVTRYIVFFWRDRFLKNLHQSTVFNLLPTQRAAFFDPTLATSAPVP